MLAVIIYISFSVFYVFFFSLASKFPKKAIQSNSDTLQEVAFTFMIPAYKEDGVIVETAKNIISQNDFGADDEVLVIADQLKPETIGKLKHLGVSVIEVVFEKSTKAKAINAALKQMSISAKKHQAVVLLDADNQLVSGFISQAKSSFLAGNKIIQTHRIAKNLDTTLAKLDAVSEEINNSIFRLGHQAVGLSAALIGSGLVMELQLFEHYLNKIDVVSGFDKQLELDIMADKLRIHYLPNCLVLDEKVRNTAIFKAQRTRWIAAQANFAKQNFWRAWYQLLTKNNLDFFNKVLQFFLPPRIILVGILLIALIISLLADKYIAPTLALNGLMGFSFLIATPTYLLKHFSIRMLAELPKVFINMLAASISIRKAKNTFIHTPHSIS